MALSTLRRADPVAHARRQTALPSGVRAVGRLAEECHHIPHCLACRNLLTRDGAQELALVIRFPFLRAACAHTAKSPPGWRRAG